METSTVEQIQLTEEEMKAITIIAKQENISAEEVLKQISLAGFKTICSDLFFSKQEINHKNKA